MTEQEFLEQLHELNNEINFAKELSFRETLACSDIQDIVDRLKLKVRPFHILFILIWFLLEAETVSRWL